MQGAEEDRHEGLAKPGPCEMGLQVSRCDRTKVSTKGVSSENGENRSARFCGNFADRRGYLKGKSAVRIHRELKKTRGTLFGRSFWSRGYCVSTVGLDEALIRRYIQNQEKHERVQERVLFNDED